MPMRKATRAVLILDRLAGVIERPETELHYRNPFELLVAVVLSAQCTDKRVNLTTPALFERFPTPEALATADPEQDVFPLIKSISYPNNKSKHLVGLAKMLLADFGGEVPEDLKDLQKLPGVGRKTANVVGAVIYDQAVIPVDTHVFRVANRLGLTKAKTVRQSEDQLMELIPAERRAEHHHRFILHGRQTCKARSPQCPKCVVNDLCSYHTLQQRKAAKAAEKAV